MMTEPVTNSLVNNTQDTSNLIKYLLRPNNPKIIKSPSERIANNDFYKQGLIYRSLITKKALKQKQDLERKLQKECTFHPKITFYQAISKVPIKKKEKEKEKDKNVICSTEPSVNQTIKKPFNEIEIFANHLYQYHSKYKMHINALSKTFEKSTCPFNPKINPSTNKINTSFLQRIADWTLKQREKQKTLNEKELHDTKTGRPFFSPILITNANHKPLSHVESKRRESEKLFKSYQQKQLVKKNKQKEQNVKFVQLSNLQLINKSSSNIVFKLYMQLYKKIFRHISNGKQIISKSNLCLDNLPKHIFYFINPLIEELLMTDETLNEKEFIGGCEYLIKGLSINEKNILIHSKII